MTWKYACGHESKAVIMSNNVLSMVAYFHWAETVGINGSMTECWTCYNKKEENKP